MFVDFDPIWGGGGGSSQESDLRIPMRAVKGD